MKAYQTAEYSFSLNCPSASGSSLTLAFFTDLHNCCGTAEADELEKRLLALKPDLVLCGGDSIIAIPGKPISETVRFLQRIAEQYPLVIGTGNHEYRTRLYPETYGPMYKLYSESLTQSPNITLLENAEKQFVINGIPVRIYGFDLPRQYYRRFTRTAVPAEEISRVFGSPDPNSVTVLLSHNPSSLPACLEWGADLSLFGHNHGGIFRLGEHSGLISPGFRLFPGDVYGHFQIRGKHGIISSGCGEHTIPVRIHNPREIVGIHITTF